MHLEARVQKSGFQKWLKISQQCVCWIKCISGLQAAWLTSICMVFCLCALSPSFFGTLKASSSDQSHFYQDRKPLVFRNAPNTHTSAPALSRWLFPLPYLQISLCSEPSRMPLSQKAFSGQTNVLCPCHTTNTFSSLRMVHRIYGLTLRVASWLFLVCWGFFISINVWAADCALDTAGLKRDGAVRMANPSCLHRRSRFSRSDISSVSGTRRPTGRIHISLGDGEFT